MKPYHIKKQERCDSCHYWEDHCDDEDAKPRTGACCRFPPQHTRESEEDEPMIMGWDYPVTGGHWWCGEYRPAEYQLDRCLAPYLLAHEDDIFLDINDFGDLAEVFELMFGRKPGNTI